MKMQIRRLTRLTNAFSKKWDNLWAALCLHFAWYNFVRIHRTLRMSPAMAAGIETRLWSMEDVVALIDAAEGEPKKRSPYKPRQTESLERQEAGEIQPAKVRPR